MPPAVQDLYDEARSVLAISRRAGAALARASLERLLKQLDPDADSHANLDTRIARMQSRVSGALSQLLTVIRHVGNKSLHVDDNPDEAVTLFLSDDDNGMAEMLFQAINDLVDELIAKPKRAAELYEHLPEGVREGAKRAATKAAEEAAAKG